MNKRACLLVVILLGLCSVPVTGASEPDGGEAPEVRIMGRTIVVNASGGGEYTRIQWAVDNASAGDTIYVEVGTYRENVVVDKTISLIGAGRENTTIDGSKFNDVVIIDADNVTIKGFTITNGGDNSHDMNGILVHNNNSTITDNTLSNNSCYGIWTISESTTIENNIITNNSIGGIRLSSSDNIIIENNTFSLNGKENICIDGTTNTFIKNNNMSGNGITLGADFLNYWNSHTITPSNLINNKPIYYLINLENGEVPSDAGQVIMVNCTNITVKNLFLMDSTIGIQLAFSSNNVIINNTCSQNSYNGISLYRSDNNIIEGNICEYNGDGIESAVYSDNNHIINNWCNFNYQGINLYWNCRYNDIINNYCNNNYQNGICVWNTYSSSISNNTCNFNDENGLYVESSNIKSIMNNAYNYNHGHGIEMEHVTGPLINNTCNDNYGNGINVFYSKVSIKNNDCSRNLLSGVNISRFWTEEILDNTIVDNERGISIHDSYNVTVSNNSIDSNKRYGLLLDHLSHNNSIYSNQFIDNNNKLTQALDNGTDNLWNTSYMGNFWSDWQEPDTDSNGIVDEPYILAGTANARDNLPLAEPLSELHPVADTGSDITTHQHIEITLNGSRSRGVICNYTWTFIHEGASISLFGPKPSFTFHTTGSYDITLEVTDTLGRSDTDTMRVIVVENTPPVADAGPDITVDQHQAVQLNASGSRDNFGIVNYTWSFPYGTEIITLYQQTASFAFHEAGTYIVTLNVTNTAGYTATDTLKVTVLDITPPIADAGEDITFNAGDTAFFNGNASQDNVGIVNYTWSFMYNNTEYVLYRSIRSFVFDIPGIYNITLTVSDLAGNRGSDNLTVTVIGNMTPDLPDDTEVEIDSDNDTFNDTYENASGSDPFNPLSTPFDIDGDGWNNTIEIQAGTDPRDVLSVPPDMDGDGIPDALDPDRDGDGVPNEEDAYPDDGKRWEDDIVIEEGYWVVVWVVGAVVVVLMVVGIVAGMMLVRRKKRDGEEDEDGSCEDELGRIGKGEGEEEGGDEGRVRIE